MKLSDACAQTTPALKQQDEEAAGAARGIELLERLRLVVKYRREFLDVLRRESLELEMLGVPEATKRLRESPEFELLGLARAVRYRIFPHPLCPKAARSRCFHWRSFAACFRWTASRGANDRPTVPQHRNRNSTPSADVTTRPPRPHFLRNVFRDARLCSG